MTNGSSSRSDDLAQLSDIMPKIMPDDQAKQYILLWDLAHEESRRSGQTIEWHWLRLVDTFLRGDLASRGVVHFYATYDGASPRAYLCYSPDDLRAKIELEARLPNLTIETLLNWTWEDYRKLSEFRPKTEDEEWRPKKEYFIERDPSGRLGLFVRRDEYGAWLARVSGHDGEQRILATAKEMNSISSAVNPAITQAIEVAGDMSDNEDGSKASKKPLLDVPLDTGLDESGPRASAQWPVDYEKFAERYFDQEVQQRRLPSQKGCMFLWGNTLGRGGYDYRRKLREAYNEVSERKGKKVGRGRPKKASA